MALFLAGVLSAGQAWARPGLETSIQDDVSFQGRPPSQVLQAVAQVRELGIDRIRLTASWSNVAPNPDSNSRPRFDATDPMAYDQTRWKDLDFAVRAAHAAGLKVMIDIGFWAPRWAAHGGDARARQDIDAHEFAEFAEAVARRYSGTFFPPGQPGSDPVIPSPPVPGPSGSSGNSGGAGSGGQGSGGGPAPLPGTAPGAPAPVPSPPAPPAGPTPRLPLARGATRRAPGSQARSRSTTGASPAAQSAKGGTPLPRVDMFTIWNEPNHPAFLLPQWRDQAGHRVPASPDEYRRMVVQSYRAIKAAQPDSAVLIGNTSSFGGRGPNDPVAPLQFLRALACVNAHLRPLRTSECTGFHAVPGDGWAHHPYSLTGTPAKAADAGHRDDVYMGDLGRLARTLDRLVAMRRLAPGLRSIYITEYGYETHPLLGRPALSQDRQALYLTWGEYLASRIPNVKMFSQFLLRDQPPAPSVVSASLRRPHGQFYSGLEEADGTPKLALQSFVASLFATRARRATLLWGRFRLGPRSYEVVIDHRSRHGQWRLVPTAPHPGGPAVMSFKLAGQDSFLRFAARAGGQYRLRYRPVDGTWATGLPIPLVPRALIG